MKQGQIKHPLSRLCFNGARHAGLRLFNENLLNSVKNAFWENSVINQDKMFLRKMQYEISGCVELHKGDSRFTQ